ncbi:MAG: hypothetical protein ABIK92_09930 [Pseudomonadota bacterium]
MEKRSGISIWLISFFLVALLPIVACAPSLQVPKSELAYLGPDEGIIVGSIEIKTGYATGEKKPFWKAKLTNTKWDVKIDKYKKGRLKNIILDKADYKVSVTVDGGETYFVTKLPTGKYKIKRIYTSGWIGTYEGPMDLYFDVINGQTTYIGKLLIEFPENITAVSTYPVNLFPIDSFQVKVSDTQNDTISQLKNEYGSLLNDISTELIITGYQVKFKDAFQKLPGDMKPEDYISIFQGENEKKKVIAAKHIVRERNFDTLILTVVENKLLEEFNYNLTDDTHVDAISWFCKILGSAGNPSYLSTLDKVYSESANEKIKNHAVYYLQDLN